MTQKQLVQFSKLLGQYMEEQLATDDANKDAKKLNDWRSYKSGIKAQYNHARLIKVKIDKVIADKIIAF